MENKRRAKEGAQTDERLDSSGGARRSGFFSGFTALFGGKKEGKEKEKKEKEKKEKEKRDRERGRGTDGQRQLMSTVGTYHGNGQRLSHTEASPSVVVHGTHAQSNSSAVSAVHTSTTSKRSLTQY